MFWRDDTPFESGSHTIDVLKGVTDTAEEDVVEPLRSADVPRLSLGNGVLTSPAAFGGPGAAVPGGGRAPGLRL